MNLIYFSPTMPRKQRIRPYTKEQMQAFTLLSSYRIHKRINPFDRYQFMFLLHHFEAKASQPLTYEATDKKLYHLLYNLSGASSYFRS
jgi:hypothetical protein